MKDIFNSKLFRFLVTAFALIALYYLLDPDYVKAWLIFLVIVILFWFFYPEPKRRKAFLPSAVKTRAEKEYNKLVRNFKSENKRSPSNNERVTLAVKTTHNIDKYRGSRGHMRRQKVRKHLVLKYKLRDKFTMSKPKK